MGAWVTEAASILSGYLGSSHVLAERDRRVMTIRARTKFIAEKIFFTGLLSIWRNLNQYGLKLVNIKRFVKVPGSARSPCKRGAKSLPRPEYSIK